MKRVPAKWTSAFRLPVTGDARPVKRMYIRMHLYNTLDLGFAKILYRHAGPENPRARMLALHAKAGQVEMNGPVFVLPCRQELKLFNNLCCEFKSLPYFSMTLRQK